MQMARSTYYFELSKADQVAVRNHCLADEIKDIFSQHKGRYGVRRVYQELIKRGHKVNHKRVQRAQRKSIIPTRARSVRLLRISLTGISARQLLCKNGLPMYLSSVFRGGSVISLLYST